MKDKIDRWLYGAHWALFHYIKSIIIAGAFLGIMKICHIRITALFSIISDSTISLSATLAGFIFAGLSVFIALDGNKKMISLKKISKDNVIYCILIHSLICFVLSSLLMLIDINLLNFPLETVESIQAMVRATVDVVSVYMLFLGFIFFFSSIRLFYWIFK